MNKKILFPVMIIITVLIFFQNCAKELKILNVYDKTLSSTNSSDVVYTTKFEEIKDPNCLENTEVDACIFYKNPTEATGLASNDMSWPKKLQEAQTTAVKFAISPEELYQEGTLTVMDFNGTRLAPHPINSYRVGASSEGFSALKHVMINYWFQKTMAFLGQLNLSQYLHATGLNVIIDAPITGWISERNVIALGKYNSNYIAMEGSVFVQLLGEAMIFHATQGQLVNPDPKHHNDCYSEKDKLVSNECCTTINGCSKALTIGISDFLSSMIFYNSPSIGNFISKNDDGIQRCGISRNPIKNQKTTFLEAYNACDKLPALGHMYTMGSIFAASLFYAYKELNTEPEVGLNYLKWIFEVSSQITNEEDFVSFYNKLESSEPASYKHTFSKALRNQLIQRGLNITTQE